MVGTLLSQLKEYRRASWLSPLFTGLEVLMEILIPFIIAELIDKGIEAGNIHEVYRYGILMLIMAFFRWRSVCWLGVFRQRRRQGLRAICAAACTLISRRFPLPTLTSTARLVWSLA